MREVLVLLSQGADALGREVASELELADWSPRVGFLSEAGWKSVNAKAVVLVLGDVDLEINDESGVSLKEETRQIIGRLGRKSSLSVLHPPTHLPIETHGLGRAFVAASCIEVMAELEDLDPAPASAIIDVRPQSIFLPPRTYSEFVDRNEMAQLERAVAMHQYVIVTGMTGTGKSSLVTEYMLRRSAENLIVHMGDVSQLGRATLDDLIERILLSGGEVRTDQLDPEERARTAYHTLAAGNTLMLIDNAETLADLRIWQFLGTIPSTTKAIITSRSLPQGAAHLPLQRLRLKGLEGEAAEQFLLATCKSLSIQEPSVDDVRDLLDTVAGNPRAIEMVLGLHQTTLQPVREITNGIRRGAAPEVLDALLNTTWSSLPTLAKDLALHLSIFMAPASRTWISDVFGRSTNDLNAALGMLERRGLLDQQRRDKRDPRLALAPLLARYLHGLEERSDLSVNECKAAYLKWATTIAESIGYCPGDLDRLTKLDDPDLRRLLLNALYLAFDEGYFGDAVRLARGLFYYFYVRGYWTPSPSVNQIRAQAAAELVDEDPLMRTERLLALSLHLNIQAKRGTVTKAFTEKDSIEILLEEGGFPGYATRQARHALALAALAAGDTTRAISQWTSLLRDELSDAGEGSIERQETYLRWLGAALLKARRLDEARKVTQDALRISREYGFSRAVASSTLLLAEVALAEHPYARGRVRRALREAEAIVPLLHDKRYEADLLRLKSHEAAALGEDGRATVLEGQASAIYQQLGMADPKQVRSRPTNGGSQ